MLPADEDEFLNTLDSDKSGREPDVYWAKLWPTALTMAAQMPQLCLSPGGEVLELGCGIGVVGLAALAAGLEVTFSDHISLAVEVALVNAARNGFPSARGLVFDWSDPTARNFDGIVGSDILYDRNQHAALVNVLESMLVPQGTAWFGDPGRYHVPLFVEMAWDRGFDIEVFDESGQLLDALTAGKYQVLRVRRQSAAGVGFLSARA
jgi:predicted nicotinamide N-methyase